MSNVNNNKKYEITETQHPNHSWLHQIRALKDIPRFGVKAGDLGGWVGNEDNLSQDGDCWISENGKVAGDYATVSDNAHVYGNAWVSSDWSDDDVVGVQVFENAEIFGDSRIEYLAKVHGNAKIYGEAKIQDEAEVYGNAEVCGDTYVSDNAKVFGNAKIKDEASVHGKGKVFGNAVIAGDANVSIEISEGLIDSGSHT